MTEATSPCLLWERGMDSKGYGVFERNGKRVLAHRHAFFEANGYLPEVVRHTCDTPRCIEPTHLLPGTQRDNVADMVERGRHVALPGERNGRAILTEDDVRAIRASGATQRELAKAYGVSRGCIKLILSRTNWRHVA